MIIKKIDSQELKNDMALSGFFYPDQFVSEKNRSQKWYIKKMLDYFASIAFSQLENKKNIIKNYKLRNGEFDFNDYVNSPEMNQIDKILGSSNYDDNPYSYLRHYPMINPPLNTLKGELISRPRKERVKAEDEMSKSEILAHRTETIFQAVVDRLQGKYQPDPETGEMPDEYYTNLQNSITSYTTMAEQWGNKALKVFKAKFNFPASNEDGFMDFLTSGEEYHHFYPDNSKLGFNYKVENPINIWYLASSNARYTTDCQAVGTIELQSMSTILDEFDLTAKEIEELTKKETSMEGDMMYTAQTPTLPDPTLLNWSMNYNVSELADATMLNSMIFGNQQHHIVIKAYWKGKKKWYKRTYLDEEGYQRTENVDENYKMDRNSGDISLEEKWTNQWYKATRIGPYVYTEIEELEWNDTCPIVGIINHTKNTKGRSLVDLMKPYQASYNVCMNQAWNLLEKEQGKVFLGSIQSIPKKDSANPVEQFLWEIKERGAAFIDTSIENAGSQIPFNQFTVLDWTRSAEIETRLKIAEALQTYCWELIGISRQRTGTVLASESATGTNTAINQSYAQTEIWFKAHEDLMNKVLQSALNIMQWVELKKPESILNYMNSELDNDFFKINRAELLRDLNVYVTSAKEDKEMVENLKQLMQPAMQNGADLIEMAEILSSNSENKLKDTLQSIQKRKDQQLAQAQQLEQEKLKQSEEQFAKSQEIAIKQHEEAIANDNLNKELDRETKISVATIQAIGIDNPNADNSDKINEASTIALQQAKDSFDRMVKIKELQQNDEKLRLEEMNIKSKEKISKSKPKSTKK